MNLIVAGIIGLFTLANISSYFVMAEKTPKFTVFLGTVHYPLDYMYYLSYIIQGKYHWLTGYHLYTGETTHLEFLNWIYVLSGRLGWFFRLDPPTIYQILVITGSVGYLLIAYKLAALLFPKNSGKPLLLFVLFLLSNAFPKIYMANGAWTLGYFHPFYNLGQPFIRLTNVPHHLIIQSAIMAALYFAVRYWQQKNLRWAIFVFFTGLILGSTQPVQWAFTGGILGLSGLFAWWTEFRHNRTHDWFRETLFAIAPAGILLIAGLIPAVYLRTLYMYPPYINAVAWESVQQISISFITFLQLHGPLMILGIIGLPFLIRKLTITSFPFILYWACAIALFFSDIPLRLHLSNNRFLSVVPTFTVAYISTELLWLTARKLDPKHQSIFAWFAALIVIIITIPVTVTQLYERTDTAGTDNVNAYLPVGAAATYRVAERLVGPTDTVLVEPLFAQSFAALTGKHVFVSNELASIDYRRKIAEASRFLYEQWSPEDKTAWLKKNNISYIFTYAWVPVALPNVEILSQNEYALFYKVK